MNEFSSLFYIHYEAGVLDLTVHIVADSFQQVYEWILKEHPDGIIYEIKHIGPVNILPPEKPIPTGQKPVGGD